MKITGGTFGTSGSAHISRDDKLVLKGAVSAVYDRDQIARIDTGRRKDRRFAAGSFLVGAVLFGFIGAQFAALVGALVGVALAVGLSFYSDSMDTVAVLFTDGRRVDLECTPRGVKRLVRFGAAG